MTDKKRDRSPNYPQISFPAACEAARKIYDVEKRYPMQAEVAAQHIGYAGLNGRSRAILSALKKYGLIDATDGDQVRISDDAFALFVLPKEDPKRPEIVRRLALRPPIFQEVLAEFPGGLPSDQNLRSNLLLKRRFTEQAANSFITAFRETMGELDALPPNAPAAPQGGDARTPEHAQAPTPDDLFGSLGFGPPRIKVTTPPPASSQLSEVDVQVWSLGDGARAELRISGKLDAKQVKKLRGYFNVFLSEFPADDEGGA